MKFKTLKVKTKHYFIWFIAGVCLLSVPWHLLLKICLSSSSVRQYLRIDTWETNSKFYTLVPISSTFYARIFCSNVISAAYLQFHVCRKSCQNDIGTKNMYIKCWWNWLLIEEQKQKQLVGLKVKMFLFSFLSNLWEWKSIQIVISSVTYLVV